MKEIEENWNIGLEEIKAAQKVLRGMFEESPLIRSEILSTELGCEVYLKLENMLPIGAFKIRGAAYKISRLSSQEKKRGVIAASAGNHAQGVAWGCRFHGVNAKIVMPETAPITKVLRTQKFGAEVVLHGSNYDEAYDHAVNLGKKENRVFVHPFRDPDIIAGQGTIGLEILEQMGAPDFVIGSIGGGGHMAGISIVMKALSPETILIGAQAAGAPSMAKSFEAGKAVELDAVNTFADGIAVKRASEQMYQILKDGISEIRTADDFEIAGAIVNLLESGKVIAEGAGALPLAILNRDRKDFLGKKVVLVISGGNIDVNVLGRIIDQALIQSGRRLRLDIEVGDRPGQLSRMATIVGQLGGNVLQAIHDRNYSSVHLDRTKISLTLETKGTDHSKELISALKNEFSSVEVLN